jgi:hypothetical protein
LEVLVFSLLDFHGGKLSTLGRNFPFSTTLDDQSHTATDLSWLNHKPAGLFGPIRIGSDGHLYAGSQLRLMDAIN